MRNQDIKRNKRAWLNKDQGQSGSVHVNMNLHYHNDNQWLYQSIELVIRDCSRSVTLDFDMHNLKEVEQRRQKLTVLRKMLDEVEWGLDKAESFIEQMNKDSEDDNTDH